MNTRYILYILYIEYDSRNQIIFIFLYCVFVFLEFTGTVAQYIVFWFEKFFVALDPSLGQI